MRGFQLSGLKYHLVMCFSISSFGYHNETSKDSTDFASLDKKSYVHAIAQHHHQQQQTQQQLSQQTQPSGDGSSNNRWTAQRKAKRGRYGGIKLQFTPAGRNKSGSAGGGGYGNQQGHHSMFSPSQNNSHHSAGEYTFTRPMATLLIQRNACRYVNDEHISDVHCMLFDLYK